jgi:hypothetical protein
MSTPIIPTSPPFQRNLVIESHKLLWEFLDTTMINKLVNLFDKTDNSSNEKIRKYIENERIAQGLNTSGITVKSEVYGYDDSNSTLYLMIKKNNIDFLHLTIHLSPKSFNPKDAGLIHMFKNFYKTPTFSITKKKKYVLISIKRQSHKPNSLFFSIEDGYTTAINDAHLYDPEIQQEMNVIITVLNRLFDEDNKDFYIGEQNKIFPIHNKTNAILKNINNHSQIVSRKNKGSRMYPPLDVNKPRLLTKYTRKTLKKHKPKRK